jgi:DNA-binding NtrC family response regulator
VRFIGRNTLSLPPLRRTPQNLLQYSEFFIQACCERFRRDPIALDLDASKIVMSYTWPGNLIELERVLERAVLLCTEDTLSVSLFPETVVEHALQARQLTRRKPLPVKIALENFILEALRRNSGNRGLVALELGVSERTLYRRLKDIRESATQ